MLMVSAALLFGMDTLMIFIVLFGMGMLMDFHLEFPLWSIDFIFFFWAEWLVYSVDNIDCDDTVVFRNRGTCALLLIIVAKALECSCWSRSLWGHCCVPHRCSWLWPAGFRIPCAAALDGRDNVFYLRFSLFFLCTCSKKVCCTWWQTTTQTLTFSTLWVVKQNLEAVRVSEMFSLSWSVSFIPFHIHFIAILFSVASVQVHCVYRPRTILTIFILSIILNPVIQTLNN